MRKHELLSEAEREQLIGIPAERDDLARLYTLEAKDSRPDPPATRDRNRLGFALQLALLRHPGTTLAQVLARSRQPPQWLVRYLAQQLDIPATAFADYAAREQTMTDHGLQRGQARAARLAIENGSVSRYTGSRTLGPETTS